MVFDEILKNYKTKTCIISVEKFSDSSYGNIRIVAGNKAHCDDVEAMRHTPFVPDSPYELYFPKDMNFEDFCFRCAFHGQPLHTYVNLYNMGLWLNMFLIPLESDKENIGYCIYSYEVTPRADADAMSDLSAETASTVIRTCIKLRSSNDIESNFNEVITDIGAICGSKQCCILLIDKEKRSCSLLCEFIKENSGLLPMKYYIEHNFYDIAETWQDTLKGSTCIIIKDKHDMDEIKHRNPVWYDSLAGADVSSLVLFPLNHGGELLGYMWALNFNVEDTVRIKETLELTSLFIAAEISNYQLVKKLELMSSIDMLTGIKNRNYMNNRVDRIVEGKERFATPYAVVFADLNGLKRVNDKEGHIAGDSMLKSAAAILQGVFYDSDVYRAGGDEFMVIVTGIAEDELEKRIAQLRKQSEQTPNVRFAIGVSFCNKDDDIRRAMHIADEKMYADKNAYYSAHPELKYR